MFRKNLINTFHARLLDDDFPDTRAGHLAKSMDYLHSSLCFLDMTVLAKLNFSALLTLSHASVYSPQAMPQRPAFFRSETI